MEVPISKFLFWSQQLPQEAAEGPKLKLCSTSIPANAAIAAKNDIFYLKIENWN